MNKFPSGFLEILVLFLRKPDGNQDKLIVINDRPWLIYNNRTLAGVLFTSDQLLKLLKFHKDAVVVKQLRCCCHEIFFSMKKTLPFVLFQFLTTACSWSDWGVKSYFFLRHIALGVCNYSIIISVFRHKWCNMKGWCDAARPNVALLVTVSSWLFTYKKDFILFIQQL